MKKQVEVNLVLEFDHDKEILQDACCIDIKRAEEILTKELAMHILEERAFKASEIVEWLARNINSDCLSFLLLVHVNKALKGIKIVE